MHQTDFEVIPASTPVPAPLGRIIRPSVQNRWTSLTLQGLTPDVIEGTLRGALNGNVLFQWQLFDLMEDTWPQLQKNLNELKRAISKVDYTATPFSFPGEKPSPLAIEKANFLARAIQGSRPDVTLNEHGFKRCIESTCDAIAKGISVQEILWEQSSWRGKMEITPRAYQWVHPRHYGYPCIGDAPDRLMLSVTGLTQPDLLFPPDQFIISLLKSKEGHPLGGAMLRCLATLWLGANFAWDWALNLAQVFGLPMRWATYDPTKPHLLDDLSEMLANMGSCGWAAFPTGTTFELKEATSNSGGNPQDKIMAIANTACDLLILGQSETSSNANGGSNAKAQVHFAVRADVIEYMAGWVAETLGPQLVAPLMRLNFGNNEEDPTLLPDVEMPGDALLMAQRDKILIGDLGLKVAAKYFYDRHEVPKPGPEDELLDLTPMQPVQAHRVPVVKLLRQLAAQATNAEVSDEQLVRAVAQAAQAMPGMIEGRTS